MAAPNLAPYNDQTKASTIASSYRDLMGREATNDEVYSWFNNPNVGNNMAAIPALIGSSSEAQAYKVKNSPENLAATTATAERATSNNAVTGLTGDLASFDQSAKNPVDVYNQALSGLGISDARTRVTSLRTQLLNTENLLKGVEGSVTGRTQDSLVTEAQRQRLVASEKAPLAGLMDTQNSAFGNAQADYTSALGEGKAQADMALQGQITARASLMDRLKLAIDSAKNIEDKTRWTAEFKQQQTVQDEAKRQFDVQQALAQRTFDQGVVQDNRDFNYTAQQDALPKASASSGSSGGGGSTKAPAKPTVESLFNGYDPAKDKRYTEQVVIPTLISTYNYTKEKASQLAYEYRKAVFGE